MNVLRLIYNFCSFLIQNFLSINEQNFDLINENVNIYQILIDENYRQTQLSLTKFKSSNQKQLRINAKTNLMKIFSQHFLMQNFINVYENSIEIKILNLKNKF